MLDGTSTQMLSYEIRNFKVYFNDENLPDANWSNFKDLGHGYGKDDNHVFYMGQIMKNAHPFSFQVADNTYAKDYQYVFQHGRIVANLQPYNSQSPINCNSGTISKQSTNSSGMSRISTHKTSYEIQDFKVYFNDQYVSDARWIDFTDLGQGYGKDSHHVFFMGHFIAHAHSFSFEVLNKGYAKDRNNVFLNGQIIEGLKPIGFGNI
ncbi:unnamed protein product [Adineta steineri]|uniref:Uncharacterized protein n=1 Tax=Adineta steineri TaxID=433720 RepID=A0A815MXV7_9BILA|nr:unnamed protein product [Adineta steineri]CAF1622728.1 unnamed protein product [Adineta steineri]